jgi:hypothetical protein
VVKLDRKIKTLSHASMESGIRLTDGYAEESNMPWIESDEHDEDEWDDDE